MNDETKRIKIAFLTAFDLQDIRAWSWAGTFQYMAQALQRHCGEVSYIGPIHCWEQLAARIIRKGSRLLLKKNFTVYHNFLVARKYAKVAAQRLARGTFDAIVAPAGVPEIAFLETDIPIVLVEDATYGLLINHYPDYSNLLSRSIYELHALESLAVKRASAIVSSSAWAAQSAIHDYHADQQKVHVVPFGANFETPPSKEVALARKKSGRCRLLFVGGDWQRKGGEIAFETLLKLEERGIQAELIVCGCLPPSTFSHERMSIVPFLDRTDERQGKEFEQLYMSSDFLLLPTRNDCTPTVFREASAYGLPSITTNTGGVAEDVRDGENGFVLPYDARGDAYAEVIAKIYQEEQHYQALVKSSRAAFEDRLNWDAWGTTVTDLIAQLPGLESRMSRSTGTPDYV